MRHFHTTLIGVPESVPLARHQVAEFLGSDFPDAWSILLQVSELVTNAVVHTRSRQGSVGLSVTVRPTEVLVEVLDSGSNTNPVVKAESLDGGGGRGLFLVEQSATSWGSSSSDSVGLVWCKTAVSQDRS